MLYSKKEINSKKKINKIKQRTARLAILGSGYVGLSTAVAFGLKGYKVDKLPMNLDHAGYAFPLVFWQYLSQNELVLSEIETPIIYRLDRRPRGEWKHRIKEYYMKME